MIARTFQLTRGVGPSREKLLWKEGIRTWSDFPEAGIALSARLDGPMRAAMNEAREALERRDALALCRMIPGRERWRLYRAFAADCAYLDIETDGTGPEAAVTCVGVLWRGEVFAFVNGFNLEDFPAFAARLTVLVTFNGLCFDVPVLERAFPGLTLPRAHVDARFAARAAGLEGGLKRLEGELGLARPGHLLGVNGMDAVHLWHAWRETGSVAALRRLVEYNLYDAIQLKPVMERVYNRCRDRRLSGAEAMPETERGDSLYDVTRVISALG